jgi:hypothetical protein
VVVQVAVPNVAYRKLLRREEGKGMRISEYLAEIAVEGFDPLDAALSYIEGAKDLCARPASSSREAT